MKSPLDQIEEKIKALFEHGAALTPWTDEQSILLQHLSESIHDCFLEPGFDDDLIADEFIFYLNPKDLHSLERQAGWQEALLLIITNSALEYTIQFEKKPHIRAVAKNSLASNNVQVKVNFSSSNPSKTDALLVQKKKETLEPVSTCEKGSLLLDNEILFNLDGPVINIGRKSNNHLVINDLRVSRNHAQIRSVSDGFIIFDTGSTGGTYVNGERISQHILKPGDVISLAGIKMIFTQDQSTLKDVPRQITSEIKALTEEE
jgi:hypothetical protein